MHFISVSSHCHIVTCKALPIKMRFISYSYSYGKIKNGKIFILLLRAFSVSFNIYNCGGLCQDINNINNSYEQCGSSLFDSWNKQNLLDGISRVKISK